MESAMNRRNFLKAAIASGAVIAAGGALAGCSPNGGSTGGSGEAEQVVGTAPVSFSEETDVLILGTGIAGMSAAMDPVEAGHKVMLVDKLDRVGGESFIACGVMNVVGSKMQKDAGIEGDPEQMWEKFLPVLEKKGETDDMDYKHNVYVYQTEWANRVAADYGSVFQPITDYMNTGAPTSMLLPGNGIGDMQAVLTPLQKGLEEKGATYKLNLRATNFIVDGEGAPIGVRFNDEKNNKTVDIRAKKIIVATGGFLGNVDMMREKFGTFVNPLGNVLSVGEGIDMVQAAGGQLSTQWGIAGNEFTGSNQKADGLYDRKSAAFTIGIYGTLLVNNQGRRFSNEGKFANLPLALGGAISLVGGKYYAVVDQAYVDGLNSGKDAWTLCGADEVNWRTGMMTLKDKPLENVQGSIDDAVSAGWAFKADTIEALAQAIDAPELVETLDEYNGYCADGNDEQFYKPACFLQPVTTGPFYAFQYEPSAWVTIGGIRTNDRLQAIDGEGVAIPGLYVAGADNGTLMSAPYCDYEGYSLMCAYCGGRLAGQYAVETIDA